MPSILTPRLAKFFPGNGFLGRLAILFSLLLGGCSGCSGPGEVTGGDESTRAAEQSETAADTSFHAGVTRIVVAYNDETGNEAKIQYGPSSRKVLRGASLMGWSYSEDYGATWKYGGKVTPPPGWAVLWGDPALVTSRSNYGLVLMSNLAFPDAKFPAGGVDGLVYSAVGGACIARSTDGGVHFGSPECLTNTEPIPDKPESTKGHFYDGGSMASSLRGEIYAAFVDIDSSQIDIWRSPDGLAKFTRLPPPFPGDLVADHPRINVGPDGTLFVMAAVKAAVGSKYQYILAANRFRDGRWKGRKDVIYPLTSGVTDVDLGSSVLGAPLKVRTGPQYSFAIGVSSADRDDSIRFLATQPDGRNGQYVRGGICDYELNSCGWYGGWTFGDTGGARFRMDVFNPTLATLSVFGVPPSWQATFLTRQGNEKTTVNLTRSILGYLDGKPISLPVDIATDVPVCSDRRGYWGDYDGFLPVQIEKEQVRFMRFMTDSSAGCVERSVFRGKRQHIRAVDYWY